MKEITVLFVIVFSAVAFAFGYMTHKEMIKESRDYNVYIRDDIDDTHRYDKYTKTNCDEVKG